MERKIWSKKSRDKKKSILLYGVEKYLMKNPKYSWDFGDVFSDTYYLKLKC